MKAAAIIVFLLFIAKFVSALSSDDQRQKAKDNPRKNLRDLYFTLRALAFPQDPLSSGPTQNRFVLMSPGKVLNYWDYYPGKDYEESLLRLNGSALEVPIPPAVMEKWFDIADVTVGADPFTGGVTGRSMAQAYETILSQMQLLGPETKSSEAQKKYNIAKAYLTNTLRDPDNVTMSTTKLDLYERYQEEYADRKLDMEEKILHKRLQSSALDYELWFQRNYLVLKAKVESAYMKWLIFGEKNLVERYKTYLDSTSSGVEVEEARKALRASGVTSLDHTRTVYPVSFEPGNWYKYLLPKQRGPSQDMLIAKRSMVESELDALKSMVAFNNQSKYQGQSTSNKLLAKLNASATQTVKKIQEAGNSARKCLSEQTSSNSTGTGQGCKEYEIKIDVAVTATFQQARVQSEYENALFLLNSKGQFNKFLKARIDRLKNELDALNSEISTTTNVYLGGVADSRDFQNLNALLNETDQHLDDNWMQFEYDSDSSHMSSHQETFSFSMSRGVGVNIEGIPVGGSVTFGTSIAELKQALNSASLKISGSILRVVIKRPWFKPNLFFDPSLSFVQRDETNQKNTYVSPGPLSEKDLKQAIEGGTDKLFLLPEYVTSFLLARDVKLEFSGIDATSVSHAIQFMVGGSLSLGYEMFSLSASVGIGLKLQTVNAHQTANGMIVTLPGAQIIGYYTEVLPTFPRNQR